jgi:hypothetical protein
LAGHFPSAIARLQGTDAATMMEGHTSALKDLLTDKVRSISRSRRAGLCLKKRRHEDFWSAMQHARQLKSEGLVIYPCEFCNGLHVGHSNPSASGAVMRERKQLIISFSKKIRKHERCRLRHEQLMNDHLHFISRLREELEEILAFYDGGGPEIDAQ